MTAPAAVLEPAQVPSRRGYRRVRHFAHRPALDGLRGLAVAGVLLFHHGIDWAVGGYLGVSAFFTLSGFLITTLLLRERDERGGLDLRQFWLRRFRRLLPAAIAAVFLALAYVVAEGDAVVLDRFRGDALSSLAYVANWRFVLSDLSYADLFAGESPLQHMWSLAIEEQFYLVLPLVAAGALRGRFPARRLAGVALAGTVLSVLLTLALGGDVDRVYYGTDTRATELLVGVILACLYHQPRLFGPRAGSARTALGALALVAMVWSWSAVGQDAGWLHPWGLLVHAVLAGAVILAALDHGPVADLLSVRPLPQLGAISYGVYLYHWPLYLWLSADRTGLDGPALLAVRLAATLVVSVLSHQLLESPIRHRRTPFRWRSIAVAAGSIAAAAAVVVAATTVIDRAPAIDFEAAAELADSLPSDDRAPDDGPTDDEPDGSDDSAEWPPSARPRVSVFGDSTALLYVPGLVAWSEQTFDLNVVEGRAGLGCGIVREGRRLGIIQVESIPEHCSFSDTWPPVLERSDPDIALVGAGIWDLVEHELPGDDTLRTLGDPRYEAYLVEELEAATELLFEHAERVVWVLQPTPVRETRAPDDPIHDRLPRFNDLLVEVFADHPRVGLVDVAAWLAQTEDGTESLRLRPDGTHFSEETSVELAEWLGPALLEAAATGGVVGPHDVEAVPVDR